MTPLGFTKCLRGGTHCVSADFINDARLKLADLHVAASFSLQTLSSDLQADVDRTTQPR